MNEINLQEWFAVEFLPNVGLIPAWAQALNVVGEAGEFAEAFRRYTGNARRYGSLDEMMLELADVVISAYGMAVIMSETVGREVSLDSFIVDKIKVIMSRGFGQQADRR